MRYVLLFLALIVASCAPNCEEPVSSETDSNAASEPLPEPTGLVLELQAVPFGVNFHNKGKTPLQVLKPIDGSEWCWVMPHYRLALVDEVGKKAHLVSRCGNHGLPYGDTRWPDDYLVVVPPGKSHFHPLDADLYNREGGRYTAVFEYKFLPGTESGPGPENPYPPGLWRGKAVSNEIVIRLSKSK